MRHVQAHAGIKGNEEADRLAGLGSDLRHKLMVQAAPSGWFREAVEQYWENRI